MMFRNMEVYVDYKAIGARIKQARQRKHITQGAVAQITGLSTPHISNIETGNTKLGLPTIISLANVLGVSVDELLCDSVTHSENIFRKELADVLNDCTVDELHIISELAKVIKKAEINQIKKPRIRRTKAQILADRAAAEEAARKAEAAAKEG